MTGAVLAGGLSKRMGEDKALLEVGGKRVIDRTVELFREIFSYVLIITPSPDNYAYLGVRMAADLLPCRGALGGLHAALFYSPTPDVFVAACDMPMLDPLVIRLMMDQPSNWDVVVPQVRGHLEPLHARYSRRCLKPIEDTLSRGSRKITDVYQSVRVKYIREEQLRSVDPELLSFININTPEDLDSLQGNPPPY